MKRSLLIRVLLLLSFGGTAQILNDTIFRNTDTVPGPYRPQNSQHIFIASKFGSNEVAHDARLDSVENFLIREIVLVYSRYHKAEKFDQAKLNDARWQNLIKEYPGLFSSGTTRFRNVCQDVSGSDTSARKLTHGFYIYYENRADPESRARELTEISKMVTALGIDTSDTEMPSSPAATASEEELPDIASRKKHSKFKKPMRARDPLACRQPFYQSGLQDLDDFFHEHIRLTPKQRRHNKKLVAEIRLKLDFNGVIRSAYVLSPDDQLIKQIRKALAEMHVWHPAVMNGVTVKSGIKFDLVYDGKEKMKLKGGITVHRNLVKCGTASDEELFDFSKKDAPAGKLMPTVFEVSDKAILRDVIKRQPTLDNLMLVVDLTGSMGPYIAQVLELMADLVVNDKPHVGCIVLFNDGDGREDRNKQVGRTGGITVLDRNIDLDKLGKAILKSMMRGNGGDVMENNLEAVLKGEKECQSCSEVLMIADNLATPRDASLVSSLKRPIHWLLCGADDGINVRYLDLVRENKGTLHTARSDVSGLELLEENQSVLIDGFKYQLKKGKFAEFR